MAVMGSSRNRRKWVVTVLSLGVAGIMFMGGTTLLSSLDIERFLHDRDYWNTENLKLTCPEMQSVMILMEQQGFAQQSIK